MATTPTPIFARPRSRSDASEESLSDESHSTLSALWCFEASHHFLLANELAQRHARFVDDFYDALEHTRGLIERQSERILAVLYDKDERIHLLEEELRRFTRKQQDLVEVGVETVRRHGQIDRAVQCESIYVSETWETERKSMQKKMKEQAEQIEVLLDELERIQAVLCDRKPSTTEEEEMKQHQEPPHEPIHVVKGTQTDTVPDQEEVFDAHEALVAISALQKQVEMVERSNADLQAKVPRDQQLDTTLSHIIERQINEALDAMDQRPVVCNALTSSGEDEEEETESPLACLDLHHRLQAVELERDQLMDQLLALRRATTPRSDQAPALARVPTVYEGRHSQCQQVTCPHSLRRVLGLVRERQQRDHDRYSSERKKTLREEISRALHGGTMEVASELIARVSMTWMKWDEAHANEIKAHQRQLRQARSTYKLGTARLADSIQRLDQENKELQVQLRSRHHPSSRPPLQITDGSEGGGTAIDINHRVLELQLSLKTKDEQLAVANQAIEAMSSRSGDVKLLQLANELQSLQEQQFKRIQPRDTAGHAVVEYFRLEKECLRLNHHLQERERELQQLQTNCEELEKTCTRLRTQRTEKELVHNLRTLVAQELKSKRIVVTSDSQALVTRVYARYMAQQSAEQWKELTKCQSRVRHMERAQAMSVSDRQGSEVWAPLRGLLSKLEEHHQTAINSFQTWRAQHSETPRWSQNDTLAVVLDQYEDLSLQLRVFQQSMGSMTTCRTTTDVGDFPDRVYLMQKLQLCEEWLLRAQTCAGCGVHLPSPPPAQTVDKSIATDTFASSVSATQTNAHRFTKSKSIQVELEMVSLSSEPSQLPLRIDYETGSGVDSAHAAMVVEMAALTRQLEASLARIDDLTQQKDMLSQRLQAALESSRTHLASQEQLLSKVREVSDTNARLTSQLSEYEQSKTRLENEQRRVPQHVVREEEMEELVRQLCAMRERCATAERLREDTERRLKQLEETTSAERSRREVDEARRLEMYMGKVSQSLEVIERDKEQLSQENHQLHSRLKEIEMEIAVREARGTRTCTTETDGVLEEQWVRSLSMFQELQTKVVLLENELVTKRDELATMMSTRQQEKLESKTSLNMERSALQAEKSRVEEIATAITTAYDDMKQEIDESMMAFTEAREAADARISFLTKCVDECSRLVYSGDRQVGVRDLYDAVVMLSKRVATAASSKLSSHSSLKPTPPRTAQPKPESLTPLLQAQTWRARCGKLEASLRAATMKTKSFEDMVDRLELEMDGLKDEVKNRMTKEAALVNKEAQLRVEISTLKSQSATLTSRLNEASSELKRSQDAAKTNDGEVHRFRVAVQRKTELLSSQKTKTEELMKTLEVTQKKVARLESAERSLSILQAKLKDQTVQIQELRQQCVLFRETSVELGSQVEKHKGTAAEAQARVKRLKLEANVLREQLKAFKKGAKHTEDSVVSGKVPPSVQNPAVDALTAQVKAFQRRVLQKQDVILAYKTKTTELDGEIVTLRTKLFDLAQASRQQQQVHREKEHSVVQGVAQLKEDLEAVIVNKTELLDGLRASIFDACEVFVHCAPPTVPSSTSESGSDAGFGLWRLEDDPLDLEVGARRTKEDDLLLELRRYADLSPDDLAELRITKTKSSRGGGGDRTGLNPNMQSARQLRKQGEALLSDLERALEVSPHDCRQEICHVLQFLSGGRIQWSPARRY